MYHDPYLIQESIELQSHAATMHRFNSQLTDKIQKNEEAATYYGTPLLKRAIEPMVNLIAAHCEAAATGGAMNRAVAFKFIRKFDPKVVALLTARKIIDRISGTNRLQDVAIQIGQALEDELRYTSFNEQHPWLFKKLLTETDTTRKRQRQTIIAAYNRYCSVWEAWAKQDKLHVGMKLIEIFIDATGFVEINSRTPVKNRTELNLVATTKVVEFMEKNKDAAALMVPIRLPMVVPPNDWSAPLSGGYITHHSPPLTFVKTSNRHYLEELDGLTGEMKDVYDAINTIQRTPWQVNPFVLVTFQMIDERGLAVAGLPAKEDIPKPPSPLNSDQDTKSLSDNDKAKFKSWKKKATLIYEENIRLKSKRLMTAKVGAIAEQFSGYSRIYFPHTLDFRGRAYPVPMYLNPQGNGLAKGLLQFADGKPLGTNEAACELAIHGANCFGYDKASMQERVDWVVENQDRILQVAASPLDDLWWAKEADEPWCFLAFCKEWQGYCENGYDHVNYIPIAKDGSCSGLQHFSAALRDPLGGAAVNLIPSDRPADIYQSVIDKTKIKVIADLNGEDAAIAQAWLDYGMTRKTAKRCTMTRVYGSTLYSARAFVQEYITENDGRRRQEDPSYISALNNLEFDASVYLARHIRTSINETVIAAKAGMDWLQDCSRILAKENLPIVWTTLDGFPVMQNYPDTRSNRVKTRLGENLVYLTLREELKNKLDKKRQSNGISPNWVHANDGCHLRMTVNLAAHNGVTHFAMIHDSFGCHAADVELLGACLRETFVDLYVENDPLANFRAEGQTLTKTELPELPTKGSLDVTAVRNSEFFFA